MSKILKIVITSTVFVLTILYFIFILFGSSNKELCISFNKNILLKAREYFANNLPEQNEVTSITVDELISIGMLTIDDLESVGTTCSGKLSVTKINDSYFYFNDMSCGVCSTDELYSAWSGWTTIFPSDIKPETIQLQTQTFYNYSKTDAKYTEWSDWTLNIDNVKVSNIPENALVLDSEIQEKTQYSYRTGEFQFYKVSSNVSYYGTNDSYYPSSPASGYVKDTKASKTLDITESYASESDLKEYLSTKDNSKYYNIVATSNHQKGVMKYEYSKEVGYVDCVFNKKYYYCYKNIPKVMAKSNISKTAAAAKKMCETEHPEAASTCETYISNSTSNLYGYRYTQNTKNYITASEYSSKKEINGTMAYTDTNCDGYFSEYSGVSSNVCAMYNPTGRPKTYYLNSEGNVTENIVSIAAYRTDEEFAKVGDVGDGFRKSGKSAVVWNKEFENGNCPSGSDPTFCRNIVTYKGVLTGWKWYKRTSSNNREYYQNKAYLTKSPGSGWIADKETAKWNEWTEFSDTKVTANVVREVKTQTLKRMRTSYIDSKTLELDTWLPLEEFEEKIKMPIEEFEKDSKYKLQKMNMYNYRILK